jgi:UDP-N-acetylmuramyl pentapeptide phosphotransferase/UDP-N-acetylglucosamine-1-phosphate transferase
MKALIASALFFLGIVEIFYGMFWGKMRIYAQEGPMLQVLGVAPEKHHFFLEYIRIFKDQWRVVALFGCINILLALILLILLKTGNSKKT